VKGLPDSADLRRRLHAVNELGEIEGIFADYLAAQRNAGTGTPELAVVSS
jgi:hypothetical protein